jgi:PadR family transcriptional regulator, regulatory protein PadR
MSEELKLSYAVAMVLQSICLGHEYGYSVMEVTGLPSGTVYPALGRLERDELILSRWEKQAAAAQTHRPPRKYYKITRAGTATLKVAKEQYPLLAKLASPAEVEQV